MENDIHHFERRLKANLVKLEGLGKNKQLILDFYNRYCIKQKLSIGRKEKLLGILRQITLRINKPLNKISEKDLENLKISINKDSFSLHTQKSYFAALKTYLRWYDKKGFVDLINCDEWKIKNPYSVAEGKIDPADLPNDETMLKLINVGNMQQRALLALLDGGGLRIGGAITLKRKDLDFTEDSAVIVSFLSKGDRNSVKIHAGLAYYLKQLYNDMALKEDDSYLFTRPDGKPWDYAYARMQLQIVSVAAGLGKLGKHKAGGWSYRRYESKKANSHIYS